MGIVPAEKKINQFYCVHAVTYRSEELLLWISGCPGASWPPKLPAPTAELSERTNEAVQMCLVKFTEISLEITPSLVLSHSAILYSIKQIFKRVKQV